MSILKNLFSPKWVQWRVVHSESEAHDIQSVFEQNGIRYKLSAYTKESRTLSSAHQFTNNRTPAAAMNSVYMSDSGLETYTFEVHRDDFQAASKLISSGGNQSESRDAGKEFNLFGWKKFYHCTDRQQADRICEILTKENIRYKVKIPEDVGRNFATAAVTSGMSFNNPANRTVTDSVKNSAGGSFTFKVHKNDIERARELDIFRELSPKPAKSKEKPAGAKSSSTIDDLEIDEKSTLVGTILRTALITLIIALVVALIVIVRLR